MRESLPIAGDRPGAVFLQCLPGYLHPRHRHDELELNLVVRGRATYQVVNRVYRIQRGSLLWLFPQQDHHVIEKSDDYTVWIAYWRPALIAQASAGDPTLAPLGSGDPPGWFCKRLGEPQVRRLHGLLREVEGAQGVALGRAGLAYALSLAWAFSSAARDEAPTGDLHPAVERAARIAAGPEAVALRALAKRCGLSAARLCTLFSRQMGMPLSAYRNQRRLERFLVEHDPHRGNLLRSALDAGFGSYSQFHRVFSRLVGLSPQAWTAREREHAAPTARGARGRRV